MEDVWGGEEVRGTFAGAWKLKKDFMGVVSMKDIIQCIFYGIILLIAYLLFG